MQVYRHLDIGTAKPEPSVTARLPHHLIDIVEPNLQFNAGDFVRRADALVESIVASGGVPIISGGTGFYLRNFALGLPTVPRGSPSFRKHLYIEAETRGWDALYSELLVADPTYARKIGASDRTRIARALEVIRTSGRPLSSFPPPQALRRDYEFLLIGLRRAREELYEHIDRRVDAMFARGLAEEVQNLRRRGFDGQAPGLQAIGYREFFVGEEEGLGQAQIKALIKRNTRRYAKRQMTFFRALPGVRWFHPDESNQVMECIQAFLSGGTESTES